MKIPCNVRCHMCGEKYYYRVTKKGKIKGITIIQVTYEGIFGKRAGETGTQYTCHSCGTKWYIKD